QMEKLGYISEERARAAMASGLRVNLDESYVEHREPYFFDYVENKLIERYGAKAVRDGGIKVYTTLQPRLQEVGLEAMRSALPYSTDPSSALVSIDPRNGRIRAMVSSSYYEESKFNLAAQGHRQPGSTIKTFVLTTAIRQGIDPYSTYYTSKPLDLYLPKWGHWTVHTADEGYLGTVNLQQATVASDNTVFAQLDLDVGPAAVAATAHQMGITSPLDGIPAEGIGGLRIGVSPLEMSSAYATLADGGQHRQPMAVTKVVFPNGHVDHPEASEPEQAVSPAAAWEVTRLLHDNITEGTGTAAYTGCAGQAGKTGTTDEYTDAWFAGYQPNLATVVWVGYPESNDISMSSVHGRTVFGGTFPAEIWRSLYTGAGVPCEEFEEPSEKVSWAPFYGRYARSSPSDDGTLSGSAGGGGTDESPPPGSAAVGGYDPNAYAPGAGQEPYSPPTPAPQDVGGGKNAGG
ncbi:MAG TPA: penicillin-binding transpeptidase domain-containing protein, partial [Solirubrobacterales bacterium]